MRARLLCGRVRRESVLQMRGAERRGVRVERFPTGVARQDRFGDCEGLGHGDVGAQLLRNDLLLLQDRRTDDRQEQHEHQDRHDRRLTRNHSQ
jgi:hypothetical protein